MSFKLNLDAYRINLNKMKQLILIVLTLIMTVKGYGQIDMADSTVQVLGYWDINEKESYKVSQEKYKIKGSDTTSRSYCNYEVDITIVDSTADSYTINWFYHDYDIASDNALSNKISALAEDMTITIMTDELGVFKEVVNWKEVRDNIYKATKIIKKETKDIPNLDKLIKQIENIYSTKTSIESVAIKEIQQFYTYHGAKYKLNEELNANMKSPNLLGGEPFDTDVTLWLDDINVEDNNYIIRMIQTINSEQLTHVTFEYITEMAKTMKVTPPNLDDFPALTNETLSASRIHGTGWLIYSIETKEVSSKGILNVEESIIELQ
jgi:hypothetical protein